MRALMAPLMRPCLAMALVLFLAPLPGAAQQDQTLADIRAELTALFAQVQRLRRELSATGGVGTGLAANIAGATPLDRLNAIEAELQRLTSSTEEMEFRVNRLAVTAENQIGDLNFRLCELEPGCDIATLPELTLNDQQPVDVAPVLPRDQLAEGPSLAIGEEGDFARAEAAIVAGDFRRAVDLLTAFTTLYPGSPLTADVHFLRGEALEGLAETTNAARAYLESFSAAPTGPQAPQALFRLGAALGQIGQIQDACLTLAEVDVRFPGDPAVADARFEMQALECQ